MKHLLFLGLIALAACMGPPAVVCNDPYILVGESCCLDRNGDAICDSDLTAKCDPERDCPQLDCTKCPAQVIERNVTTVETKYICQKSGEVVSSVDECRGSNLAEQYTPIKTNEENSIIEEFTVRGACRDGFNAVELRYILPSEPTQVIIEVKDSAESGYRTVYNGTAQKEEYLYGVFCGSICTGLADFFLEPGKAYLLRARFDYRDSLGKFQLSNEHVIDATEESLYITKLC